MPSRIPARYAISGNERAYALVGAVTIAFSSILVRLSHASPSTAAIFRCVYALPILGLLAWIEDRRFGARSWRERRAGLVAGIFFSADLLLWHHSIGDVGAGLATVLANIQVVLLPLVAWALLSERPGPRVLLALPVSLVGVLLISGVLEHGAFGRNPTRGALFGVGAGIAYVGFLLLLRQGGADLRRPAGPLCDATVVAAVLCVAAGLVIGDARLVPELAGRGMAAHAGAQLAGHGLAHHRRDATAAAGRDDVAAAHRAADRDVSPGRAHLRRGPQRPSARRRPAGARGPAGGQRVAAAPRRPRAQR